MSEPATSPPLADDEAPSLDPAVIERAYRRERTRRRVRSTRHEDARNSNARFYVAIAVLLFLTVVISLGAMRLIQQTFGI